MVSNDLLLDFINYYCGLCLVSLFYRLFQLPKPILIYINLKLILIYEFETYFNI